MAISNRSVNLEEIEMLSEQKRMKIVEDEARWSHMIKRRMQEEIERRVKEALDPIPTQKHGHGGDSSDTSSKDEKEYLARLRDLNDRILANLTERESEYLKSKKWRKVRRKKIKILLEKRDEILNKENDDLKLYYEGLHRPLNERSTEPKSSEEIDHMLPPRITTPPSANRTLENTQQRETMKELLRRQYGREKLFQRKIELADYAYTKDGFLEALAEKKLRLVFSYNNNAFSSTSQNWLNSRPSSSQSVPSITSANLPTSSMIRQPPTLLNADGLYADAFDILRDRDGPFCPIDVQPLFPAPQFRFGCEPEFEPLLNLSSQEKDDVKIVSHLENEGLLEGRKNGSLKKHSGEGIIIT